jgi:cysteine desulfurase / selenocysteine lyase
MSAPVVKQQQQHGPLDVARIRDDFPILSTILHADSPDGPVPLIYFDNGASTQHPRQVIDRMVSVYEHDYANVHRGIHTLSDRATDLYERARDTVQSLIHAREREEIVFTRGTTESINLVARSFGDANLRAGDEILLTEMEHHANIVPWQQAAARTGAVVRFLPITDDGQLALDRLPEFLNERTRIVAVTAISNVLGGVNPTPLIVAAAHACGAVLLVDAAQSAPHMPIDVQASGVDFLAFSGHKMLGPSGVGVLYGRRELLEAMPPFLGGGSMIRRVTTEGFEPAELPTKFEAGTPPIVPAIGLGTAIDYLKAVGLPAIVEHEHVLCRRAHQVLGTIAGLHFLGPAPEHKTGIVSFVLEKIHAHDIAQLLDRQGIAVRAGHHCAMPLHKRLGINASTRASFYLYNTLEEVDKLGQALENVQRLFRRK